jgi:uncharacterized protein
LITSAVLDRTPYDAAVYEPLLGALFIPKNYITVVQDMRGRYNSQGEWEFWRKDADDGYDTINWITSQSWSDGNVMSFGISGKFDSSKLVVSFGFVKKYKEQIVIIYSI